MRTLPMYGQIFRPAQETGIVKPESMASHQQTSIQRYPELTMNHRNSLYRSVGAQFSRLTDHLVFAFLGGYVSMDDLPCLGDLANENNWCHGTNPISMDPHSKSNQVTSLDQNENLHQLSAIFMDLDFISRNMDDLRKSVKSRECDQKPVENVSIVLDTFDASSTASITSLEHSSQRTDEIESLLDNSTNAHLISNKSVIDILNLDCPTPSMPFQQRDFTGKFVLSTIALVLPTDSLDSNSAPDTLFENLAFKQHKINLNRSAEIQEYDLHKHALTSGNLESQFHRHHKKLNDVPVSNPCLTPASNNKPINDGNVFSIPNPGTLTDYLYGDLEIPQFLDAESSGLQLEVSCCTIGNNGEGSTFSVPDPSQLMDFLYGDLESPVLLSSESIKEVVHSISSISNYADRYSDRSSEKKMTSQSVDHTNEESPQCSPINSWAIQQTVSGLMTESLRDSNGFTNGMDFKRVTISSNSQSAEKTSEISDSKLSYHRDVFNVADHTNKCISEVHNTPATEPKEPLPKNPTTFVPTTIPLSYKSEEDEENMTTDLLPFASNTALPSLMNENSANDSYENPEIYVSSPCCDQKVCLLGDCGSDDDAEVADLSERTLNVLFSRLRTYNTLNLSIEYKIGSLTEAFEGNEVAPTSSALLECNRKQIGSDSSFFDLSHYDDLLEYYGLSNQDQYTDTAYSCESPSWPGKSEGQTQKSLTRLMSNKTKDDNANGILTADSSLFHSNTDETSVMNKNWADEIYERNSEISVSPCYLNQMECAFETSFIPNYGSIDCVHSCSDDSGDSIEHQSLKNDKNELKFGFPDPSALKDYIFGSLDSPKFLASELLDGKIDNLHYPSFFGYCELDHSTDGTDLSDKMIFNQCYEYGSSKNDSSINKFSCSIQLLDVSSSSFDISDHDKLLEWYGINDQDQFMDGNWTCGSPTWPGKI